MDTQHQQPRRPARSPNPPQSPDRSGAESRQSERSVVSDSGSEVSSNFAPAPLHLPKRSPYGQQLPSFVSSKNASTSSVNQLRPSAQYMAALETPGAGAVGRKGSSLAPSPSPTPGSASAHASSHRRQHSQGYFEPSMPSTSNLTGGGPHGMDPSKIAAQAAMQHLHLGAQHIRRRSSTIPFPEQEDRARRNSHGSVSSDGTSPSPAEQQYKNGLVGDKAAATAATAVWTKPQPEEKEKKGLRSRFRPKGIGIMKDKDKEGRDKPLPSPNKLPTSGLAKVYNASTASLADSLAQNSSMYSLQNHSTNTIIPVRSEEEKKSKHHGFRQKLKLKEKDEHGLQLSSANSNSRPVDANNPQSLYSFAPSSPNHSSFAKSVSGLDLRKHRDRKKNKDDDKSGLEPVYSRGESDTSEWPSLHSWTTGQSNGTDGFTPYSRELKDTLATFGLNNMNPEDAWEFLRAKLLLLYTGEDVRIAVEDLNRLVTIHVQRCVLQRDPISVIDNLESLFNTGFDSLNHTLRGVQDERLVPNLVDLWMTVFGTILPFMQAVFLPLDQEFKGRGTVLKTPTLAAEFWGALPHPETQSRLSSSPTSASDTNTLDIAAGEELEVRRILLISFRDKVILPRFDVLKATFSRLSIESINATLAHFESSGRARGDSLGSFADRPGTGSSNREDPRISSSYSSQTTTLLGGSSGVRSRATSNLSARSGGSSSAQDVAFQSFSSPPAARPTDTSSAQVTETVGRMLQCLLVLSSVQSGDESQSKMEELTRQLKLNWLGRGRTGRNRKGFVGTRTAGARRSGASTIRGIDAGSSGFSGISSLANALRDRERDGSPTPTPTRQGTVSRQSERDRDLT